jgi:hypothetical protein
VSLQTTGRQRDDRREQENRRRDSDDEGAVHSVITIRPSLAARKRAASFGYAIESTSVRQFTD